MCFDPKLYVFLFVYTLNQGQYLYNNCCIFEVPFRRVCEIDFHCARRKYKMKTCYNQDLSLVVAPKKSKPSISQDEVSKFFTEIAQSKSKPAILSLLAEHSNSYVSKLQSLPKPLSCLYDKTINSSFDDLIVVCQTIDINLTKENCLAVAAATVEQRKCKTWYSQRASRITASNLKSICSATESCSVTKLVQRICYPQCYKFTTAATE